MSSKSASDFLLKFGKVIPPLLAENKLDEAAVASQILGWLDSAAHPEPMDDNAHYNHACIKSLQAEILAARRQRDSEKVSESDVSALEEESLKHLKIYLSEHDGDRKMADQDRDLQHVRGLPGYAEMVKNQ